MLVSLHLGFELSKKLLRHEVWKQHNRNLHTMTGLSHKFSHVIPLEHVWEPKSLPWHPMTDKHPQIHSCGKADLWEWNRCVYRETAHLLSNHSPPCQRRGPHICLLCWDSCLLWWVAYLGRLEAGVLSWHAPTLCCLRVVWSLCLLRHKEVTLRCNKQDMSWMRCCDTLYAQHDWCVVMCSACMMTGVLWYVLHAWWYFLHAWNALCVPYVRYIIVVQMWYASWSPPCLDKAGKQQMQQPMNWRLLASLLIPVTSTLDHEVAVISQSNLKYLQELLAVLRQLSYSPSEEIRKQAASQNEYVDECIHRQAAL